MDPKTGKGRYIVCIFTHSPSVVHADTITYACVSPYVGNTPSGKVAGSKGPKRMWQALKLGVNPLLWSSLLVLLHSQVFQSLFQRSNLEHNIDMKLEGCLLYNKCICSSALIVFRFINGAFRKGNSWFNLQPVKEKSYCGNQNVHFFLALSSTRCFVFWYSRLSLLSQRKFTGHWLIHLLWNISNWLWWYDVNLSSGCRL